MNRRVLARIQKEIGSSRIFTVGIDTAVNQGFLSRLAALGEGTSTFVEPGASLDDALRAISREIGAPMIVDVATGGFGFKHKYGNNFTCPNSGSFCRSF